MDDTSREVLAEFMALFVRNWTGNAAETTMRVRALQDLSELDTTALLNLASQTAGNPTRRKRPGH